MDDRGNDTDDVERPDDPSHSKVNRPSQLDDDGAFGAPEESSVLDAPVRMLRWAWVLVWTRRGLQAVGGTLLLLFVVVFGYSRSDDFQQRVKRLIEAAASDALCEDVTVARVNLSVWPPGATAVDVAVTERDSGQTILAAQRLRAPVRVGWSGFGLGRLFVEGLDVALHLDERGRLVEFADCDRPPNDNPRPLRRLPFTGLRVDGASFRLDHPEGFVRIEDLWVEPKFGGRADIRADFDYRVRDVAGSTHMEWPGAIIGGDQVVVPRFGIDLPMLSTWGTLAWREGNFDTDLTARVQLEQFQPWLSEPREVEGAVDVDLRLEGDATDPRLLVVGAVDDLEVQVAGVLRPVLRHRVGDVRLVATARKDGIHVEEAIWERGDGSVKLWALVLPDGTVVDGHAIGDRMKLADLLVDFDAAPTPWVNMSMDAEVSFTGTLKPLRLEGPFDFAVATLEVGDRPIANPAAARLLAIPYAHASGQLLFEQKKVTLDAPIVRAPRNQGSALVEIGLGPRGPLDLRFDLWGADLEDFQPLAKTNLKGQGQVSGQIWGPFNGLQVEGEGHLWDFEVLGVPYADELIAKVRSPDMKSLHLEEATARVGNTTYRGRYAIDFRPPLSMSTDITFDEGRIEDVVGMFIDLDGGLVGDLVEGSLVFDGPLYHLEGESRLQLSDVALYGEQFPSGSAKGYLDDGRFTLDDLRLRRDGGKAGLTLRGSVDRKWALDMQLIGDGLRLENLDRLADTELPLSGRIALRSRITNTLFDPSPDGRIWVTDVRYAGEPVEDSWVEFDTEEGGAALSGSLIGGAVTLERGSTFGWWERQPYDIGAKLVNVPAHLLYPTGADGTPIRAEASGRVAVKGSLAEDGPEHIDVLLPHVDVRYAGHTLRNEEGSWRFAQRGDRYQLENFNLRTANVELPSTKFNLGATRDEELLLLGEGYMDLDLLRAVVPGLSRAAGRADVKFKALGAPPNLDAVADVTFDASLLRHDSAPLSFEDVKGEVEVTQDGVTIGLLEAGLGGGSFTVEGSIESKDWWPVRYDLEMNARDAQVQWVDTLPPAIGNGTFTFDGPTDQLLMAGDIEVTDMTWSDRIDWESWLFELSTSLLADAAPPDTASLFNLNVAIAADHTIRMENNVAEGVGSADLRIIGDTNRPGLVGTVTVHEGLAFLQDREFRIDRGNLLFNDPWTWDPQLDIALQTDVNSQGQLYRINYRVNGPFSDWTSTASSDPPLPQSDVNVLLWYGVTLDELQQAQGSVSAAVIALSDLLVTGLVSGGRSGVFGTELPDILQPDRIDLVTGVNSWGDYSSDPRLVVDKRIRELGDLDFRADFNLRSRDTYFSLGKRIGGAWSLSGWYSTLQRDRVLSIGGSYGLDVSAQLEIE
ncbi:MAG: translocation/assembly module TamB domain-containing protein [Myxococcota bacterium]